MENQNEVKKEMLTPLYWTKDRNIVMDSNAIKNFNNLILNDKNSRRFSLKYGNLPTYNDKKNFVLYNLNKYQKDISSINIDNISNEIINGLNNFGKEYKYGICIKRDAMMSLPLTGTWEECKPYILSPLHINEGVIIYSSTENEKWFFVRSAIYYGWVHSESIALCHNRDEMIDYLDYKSFLVVTDDSLLISSDNTNQIKYDMGDKIELIDETLENYLVTIFDKNDKHYVTKNNYTIPKTADVNKGYCTFTKINLLDKCFKLFGTPYKWGGGEGARDCSSTMMEIFSCFGFQFPRNSMWQSEMPLKNIILSDLDRHQKSKVLDSLDLCSLLFTNSHVMLYLGCIENNHYIFHNASVFCQNNNSNKIYQYSVTINTLEKTYTTKGVCLIDALTKAISFQ